MTLAFVLDDVANDPEVVSAAGAMQVVTTASGPSLRPAQ
jgi:hypothetical protein